MQKMWEQLTLFSEEPPARETASPAKEREWMTHVLNWPSTISAFALSLAQGGSSGRMSPAYFRCEEDGTLVSFSKRFRNAGMGMPTDAWMLNSSVSPSDAKESFFADILETGDVPQRYYLTPQACAGILRRAKARGKTLPVPLRKALEAVVDQDNNQKR